MYEKEYTTEAWLSRYLGTITKAVTSPKEKDMIYVASKARQNMLSKMNVKENSIIWKQDLKHDINHLIPTKHGILTLQQGCRELTMWNKNGVAVWNKNIEAVTKNPLSQNRCEYFITKEDQKLVVIGGEFFGLVGLKSGETTVVRQAKDGEFFVGVRNPKDKEGLFEIISVFQHHQQINKIARTLVNREGQGKRKMFEFQHPISILHLGHIKTSEDQAYIIDNLKRVLYRINLDNFSTNDHVNIGESLNMKGIQLYRPNRNILLRIGEKTLRVEENNLIEEAHTIYDKRGHFILSQKKMSFVDYASNKKVTISLESTNGRSIQFASFVFPRLVMVQTDLDRTLFISTLKKKNRKVIEREDGLAYIIQSTFFNIGKQSMTHYGRKKVLFAVTNKNLGVGIDVSSGHIQYRVILPSTPTMFMEYLEPKKIDSFMVVLRDANQILEIGKSTGTIHDTLNSSSLDQGYFIQQDGFIMHYHDDIMDIYPKKYQPMIERQLMYNPIYFDVLHENILVGYKYNGHNVTSTWEITFKSSKVHCVSHRRSQSYSSIIPAVTRPTPFAGISSRKHKYINPNLGACVIEEGNHNHQLITFDRVSGQIIYNTYIQALEGSIRLLIDGHALFYTFVESKSGKSQITTVEFFSPPSSPTMWQVLFGTPSRDMLSSLQTAYGFIHYHRQTYLTPAPIEAITTSSTLNGITPKQLYLLTSFGTVYAYDCDVTLSARRRKSQHVYHPLLTPFNPKTRLGNVSLTTPHSILTSFSMLESSIHVFAHGSDVFYHLHTPRGNFDRLTHDYPFSLVLIMMVCFILVTVALRQFISYRKLRKAWA